MKYYFSFLIAALLLVNIAIAQEDGCKVREKVTVKEEGLTEPDLTTPWVKTFEENFEGTELNRNIWLEAQGAPVNTELSQIYTTDNLMVGNGKLRIQSRHEPREYYWEEWESETNSHVLKSGFYEFTAGEIRTKPTFGYGAFQARCKLPRGKGAFPAFWTYGDPCWHEIDFFEFANKRTMRIFDLDKTVRTIDMTIHRDTDCDGGSSNCKGSIEGPDFSAEFHTFTGVYTPYHIHFYCDDVLMYTYYRYQDPKTKEPFRVWEETFPLDPDRELLRNPVYPTEPMHIFVNLALLGGKDKPNVESYTMNYDIDFVRYYQQIKCDEKIVVKNREDLNIKTKLWNVVAGTEVDLRDLRLDRDEHLEVIVSDAAKIANSVKTAGYWSKTKTDSIWRGGSYHVLQDRDFCTRGKSLAAVAVGSEERKRSKPKEPQQFETSLLRTNIELGLVTTDSDYRFLQPRNSTPLFELSKGKQSKIWETYDDEMALWEDSYVLSITSNTKLEESMINVSGGSNMGNVQLNIFDEEGMLYSQHTVTPNEAMLLPMKKYASGIYLLEFLDPLGQIIETRRLIKG